MKIIRAFFDGQEIKPIEPIKTKKKTEILVIFPNDIEKNIETFTHEEARALLRGSGKGERLIEKLLRSRAEDIKIEKR